MAYTYDALGQLTRVNDPSAPAAGESGTICFYNDVRGANGLSKLCQATPRERRASVLDSILCPYRENHWKDI